LSLALPCLCATGCSEEPPTGGTDVPVPVVAETAAVREVVDYVDAVGRVEAETTSTVGSQLPGRIDRMLREVGDLVPGRRSETNPDPAALLAKLDTEALEAKRQRLKAEIDLAAANLDQLRKDWQRAEELLKAGSGTEQRRDQAKAAYDIARAKVDAAKAARDEVLVQIRQSSIYAPFDAVVVKKHASVGDVVSPMFSPQLYDLECIRDLKINGILRERDVPRVKGGMEAEITFDALPGRSPFTERIHTVVPSGDPVAHSFLAEIRFRNRTASRPLPAELPEDLTPEDLLIKPGMFARIRILTYRKEKATVVPEHCLVRQSGDAFVYRITPDNRATKTPVKAGVVMEHWVEITGGLEPGQRVVGRGKENVTEGQPVRVIETGSVPKAVARPPAVSAGP
jgi:membrane fusion protein (multidrug efflux system)